MPTTPAIVTQLAARRLPRWVLLLLGLAYVLPGLLGREPWRHDELAAFGAMLDLSQHPGHLGQPQVLGQAAALAGWLPYGLGGWLVRALPGLPAELAARLPVGAMLVATLVCTWYAMYHLARVPGAQPVSFAFGGEARPVDYARAMADAALLALVASLGLAQLAHETTPSPAQLCFSAVLLYAAARLVSPHARWLSLSVAVWWLGMLGLSWSGAPGLALALGLVWLLGAPLTGTAGLQGWRGRGLWLACALGTAGAAASGVWLDGWSPSPMPGLRAWTDTDSWRSLGRLLVWFTWPAGLLALWTVWRWRRRWREAHLLLPLWWVLAALGSVFWLGGRDADRALLPALPALACLAALALPTLSRTVTALIDWFALVFFTGGALIVWVIYLAMMTGTPAKPAANVAKLVPGFEPAFAWGQFLPALLATVAWLGVLAWRIGRHRPALWKSLVLSASGSTLCWLLLMTLWLPLLNFGLGQAPISRRIAAVTPPGACVLVHGLDAAQITGLQHHGGLPLRRWQPSSPDATDCPRLVLHPAAYRHLPPDALQAWSLMASVPRLRENRDHLMVFERRP
ncbi:hypothetical protein [Aquabacterium sp. A08]|uniref:hypothetical protein n=1 Tax=Aquabacterium sp. A08 TaxID=2718532 RepID=UPI001420F5A5|nr:hypothetical protein [Aquabacterium sp. A08]NIC40083.1 hypothetical protein [Aquabacterium sp. A08]